ncbi:MAG TPA: TIGR00725 family protein [Acidimicrobiales bacterium]|nr:TIGR00725 family protein [Acidimicrobiales bacterium]
MGPRYIAVVGGSEATEAQQADAEAVGRALAEGGAILVCGGRGGVMEAACRGAKAGGGTTVGILPGADRAEANPWVDVALPTGLGEARNVLVVRAADALVAVGGGFGTLSEIALALRLGKPVVGLGTWDLSSPGPDRVVRVDSPGQAAAEALRLAAAPAPPAS